MKNFDFYKEKLLEKYKKSNNEQIFKRYEHSINVANIALELIDKHSLNIDKDKAYIASILHDYAKYVSHDEFLDVAIRRNVDLGTLEGSEKVWHALLGRYIVEEELGITDEDILSAIEFHATGNSDMTPLQELLYVSDYVEIGRTYPECIKARDIAFVNIRKAIAFEANDVYKSVMEKGVVINPYTISCYTFYKKYLSKKQTKLENVLETINRNLVKDIAIYDARGVSCYYDYIIVASATSNRQMQAALNYLRQEYEIRGSEVSLNWTLIDLSDIIIHIFEEEERKKYAIERLYASLPQVDYKTLVD